MIFTLELLVVGAVTGLVSGLIGVGGGFIFIPLLTLIGVPMRSAAGLSLLYVAFTATSGAASHYRQGTTDFMVASAVAPAALITVPVGSYYSGILPNSILQVTFGLLVLAAASALQWQSTRRNPFPGVSILGTGMNRPIWVVVRRAKVQGNEYLFPVSLLRGVAVGGVTGFLAGLLGLGGGSLLVVLLMLVVGVPAPIAAGTSLLAILIPAIAGAITHYGLGHINIVSAIPAVLAGILGSVLGARGTVILSEARLQSIMIWLLALVAVYMIGRGIL
ncbi:MAG: sulfite exporter TauE/SafE family protein [Candidatus Methylomirabilales bacterium]